MDNERIHQQNQNVENENGKDCNLSRRSFLHRAALLPAVVFTAACAPNRSAVTVPTAKIGETIPNVEPTEVDILEIRGIIIDEIIHTVVQPITFPDAQVDPKNVTQYLLPSQLNKEVSYLLADIVTPAGKDFAKLNMGDQVRIMDETGNYHNVKISNVLAFQTVIPNDLFSDQIPIDPVTLQPIPPENSPETYYRITSGETILRAVNLDTLNDGKRTLVLQTCIPNGVFNWGRRMAVGTYNE